MSKTPIRSMTGYARVRREVPAGEFVISLRSVNHRGLDLHFHAPAELDPYETALRKAITGCVTRGHVDVRISAKPASIANGEAAWNRPLMDAWFAAFRSARDHYGLSGDPDLNVAFRIPGMLADIASEEPSPQVEAELVAACREALDLLNEFRTREGEETAGLVRGIVSRIQQAAVEMEQIRETIAPALQARLHDRLTELLKSATIEPQRLAQEAAILADRSDVGEEIARLQIHAGQLESLLEEGGEVGKKLDFLLQEMHREANTVLSKSNGAGEPGRRITELALALKSDIEKIREQSLNLE
jgi:uncharacterized protein (TIGR00255 family)